jgi:two-component system sensor histidine kinase/response regulator
MPFKIRLVIPGSFRRVIRYLVGGREFSLENRIFNAIYLVILLIMAYNIPFNYYAGLHETAWIFAALCLVFLGMYYLCRFAGKMYLSMILSIALAHIAFALNYFVSSGIAGASLLSFSLTFFLMTILSPRRHYVYWLVTNIALVMGVLWLEYHYPDLMSRMYATRAEQFADLASTYIITILVIFAGTFYFRRAYEKERHIAEEKSAALERQDMEKNKLFSIISHDFRSPLDTIEGYLHMLKEDGLGAEEQRRMQEELLLEVNRTQDLLYNMLSWSRAQLGGLKAELRPVLLSALIGSVVENKQAAIREKNLQLHVDVQEELSAQADIYMLQIILRNLLGNAVKFSPSGGTITITAQRTGDRCLLTICDSGAGIPAEKQQDIFSLHIRSGYGTNNEKGTGLGLFLCKEYTEALHGRIWFESETGVGSRFYLELPAV